MLALGAIGFALAFRVEVVRAIGVWEESTAYNHCFLILPISAYLIWERRHMLLARVPAPTAWPLLAMLPVAAIWLLATQLHVMEGQQLMAMTLFQLFLLAVLGFPAWRIVAFALLYLYFLVPAGAFITPLLQTFAAKFAIRGVELLNIPIYSNGFDVELPGARFTVAEACAGLRFLIASVALGTLYGYMMYRSWWRRGAFILVSIIVPIIANGLRVLGLFLAGYWLGDAKAATADHLLYGWVFFSLVSLLLIVLGMPFRQDIPFFPAQAAAPAAGRLQMRMAVVGLGSLVFVGLLTSPLVAAGPVGAAVGTAAAGLKHAIGH
jgi:exosortase A